jgi:hypothetical protein
LGLKPGSKPFEVQIKKATKPFIPKSPLSGLFHPTSSGLGHLLLLQNKDFTKNAQLLIKRALIDGEWTFLWELRL